MKLATVFSRSQHGIYAQPITIEVHLTNGLPKFTIVGLPEASVRESRDRVHGAIQNTGFIFPNKRITVLCKMNRNKWNLYYVLSFSNLLCLALP